MSQFRPRPPSDDDLTPNPITVRRGGWRYNISDIASDTLTAAADEDTGAREITALDDDVAVRQARAEIGWKGIQRAAEDAGAPRSRSTIYRWTSPDADRIPDPRVAELVQRRAFVARQGGIDALAERLGVSPQTVSHWQTGHTDSMRGDAGRHLARTQLEDARERAGESTINGAVVNIVAGIEYRHAGDQYQELGPGRDVRHTTLVLDASTATDLAVAMRTGNYAEAVMILEAAWTTEWGTFPDYSDHEGVHLVEVESFQVNWT